MLIFKELKLFNTDKNVQQFWDKMRQYKNDKNKINYRAFKIRNS